MISNPFLLREHPHLVQLLRVVMGHAHQRWLLALATDCPMLLAGVALWGLQAAMVADTAPDELRGTAFGLFNLVSSVAMLLAGVIAGLLWDRLGAPAIFVAGGGLAALARCC